MEKDSEISNASEEQDSQIEGDILEIPSEITLSDLANLMDVNPVELIKEFMRNGFMLAINDVIEFDVASPVARTFGYILDLVDREPSKQAALDSSTQDTSEDLESRPPIVTILGHVDHGKTTLLDNIRNSNVVDGEAGNITQHIGAYQVDFNSNKITFLDTPGHQAFSSMRARGAYLTDIIIIVIAADDGIMPQTLEAIAHAKASKVPIIVAINKIDHPAADQEKVKRQLSENDLLIEEWGGDVICVGISALNGDGVDDLLENILVVAEVSDLKTKSSNDVKGIVLEARTDKRKGILATVIIQQGRLEIGDHLVLGSHKNKVRAMFNDLGNPVTEALPSSPVEILGLSILPNAGDSISATSDERMMSQIIKDNEKDIDDSYQLSEIHSGIESSNIRSVNLVIKTDVQGTLEPVRTSLESLNSEDSRITIIHAASGGVSESDVLLAAASDAMIIGFNSPLEPGALTLATQSNVKLRSYNIIYHLLDDVTKVLKGLEDPVYEDVIEGQATIRATFDIGKGVSVAGFYVNDGKITKDSVVHIYRDQKKLFEGDINTLKHLKDDVRDVKTGFEGGLTVDGFNDYLEGDIIEAHKTVVVE
jgi:translation initiation factor IF-2